jgi:lycopene cyclase domain-containing protein
MKYTYLLIDFLSVLVPFLFSFHPKFEFYRQWKTLFPAMFIAAALFIPFDIYFTYLHVWGFNPAYVSGYYICNLPVEELLFFLCIPYSCLFTYDCLTVLFSKDIPLKSVNIFTGILIGFCLLMVVMFHKHAYTFFAFALMGILLFTAQFVLKITWITKFYYTYAILLLPFLIVNGLLTGTGLKAPIVWYNNAENMNLRILTIPVEDFFYGMSLVLLNLLIFKLVSAKFYNDNISRQVIKYSENSNNKSE